MSEQGRVITYADAGVEALREEMARDTSIVYIGQGIGPRGGNFRQTRGLWKEFGDERLRDTGICELGATGVAIGAAMAGTRTVVDEVFLDYSHAGPHPTFAAGLLDVPVFVVSGLSKIAGLPQMKAGWIVATGPHAPAALDRLEVIADTFLSMNAPIQCALPPWLQQRSIIQTQIQDRVLANLSDLDRQLAHTPDVTRLRLQGGWYAVLRIPALQPDDQTVLNLLDCGVWVHPGHFFGFPQAGWLVVSLLAASAEFSTGVTALVNYLRTHQAGNNN